MELILMQFEDNPTKLAVAEVQLRQIQDSMRGRQYVSQEEILLLHAVEGQVLKYGGDPSMIL